MLSAHYTMGGTINDYADWLGTDTTAVIDTFPLEVDHYQITFPIGLVGQFFISVFVHGGNAIESTAPLLEYTNCSPVYGFSGGSLAIVGSVSNPFYMVQNTLIEISNPAVHAVVQWDSGVYNDTITGGDIYVFQHTNV